MKRRIGAALVMMGLLVCVSAVFAGAEARRIVEKAIQAQGGETMVAKLRTMRIKLEGTWYPGLGQPKLPCIIE